MTAYILKTWQNKRRTLDRHVEEFLAARRLRTYTRIIVVRLANLLCGTHATNMHSSQFLALRSKEESNNEPTSTKYSLRN